jgi:inorganic pyrophosphatase
MKVIKHKPHPWHGLSNGDNCPDEVVAYIEIVPSDTVKYEIDKESGYLKINRPQKYSNLVPALYGFIPRTYCGSKVAALAKKHSGKKVIKGDGDPLDICVLTEKNIANGDIILDAIPIGGLRMIDKGEADDKIIAVLKEDQVYGDYKDIQDCPPALIDRLMHYFLTAKQMPGDKNKVEITTVYGRKEALEVIRTSIKDYKSSFKD